MLGVAAAEARAGAAVSISQVSSTDWKISNGDLNVVFDPAGGKLTSIAVGSGSNILDPGNSQLYPEFAGTPFGSGATSYNYSLGPNNSYIDFSTTTASTGTSTNPITYSFHYVMYANDPGIAMYEVLSHSATDPVTSVGQGQFLMRANPNLFTNTYQYNTSVNNLGAQTSAFPSATSAAAESTYQAAEGNSARQVQNAATDLTGTGVAGDFGTSFATKYDFSSYEQLRQAQLEYGPTYAISSLATSEESMTGGPTKQNLQFTDQILMAEFLSDHYGADPGYAYTPAQGVATSRLFGPYVFRVTTTNGESGSQLYNDAVAAIPGYRSLFDTDATLIANGYTPAAQRGALSATIANPAGWSSNVNNNTLVLSDPHANFQKSTQGEQYWTQISSTGTASISGIVPGTYRASIYQYGQWGETRLDNVQVQNGKVTLPANFTFTPQNFSTAAPIWTIGTPNRSANEFLNGHNSTGGDVRQFYGAYDYWAEEQALGTPGKVVYYATAVGATAATNDPSKWIANQWKTFDPSLYDSANNSTDNYANIAPAYVKSAGGPASYSGSPWEVHFTTTAAQNAQGAYVLLSVGLAATEASLTVALNGHSETYHYDSASTSDPMVRSGDAGFYQWLVFQYPVADLLAAGSNDDFTFSVSQTQGVMYDALRMEIGGTADPSVTGWHDYTWVTGANTQVNADDSLGQTAIQTLVTVPEPSALLLAGATAAVAALSRRRNHLR